MKRKLDIIIKTKGKGIYIPAPYRSVFKEIIEWCNKHRQGNVRVQISPPVKKRSTGKGSQNHHINGHIRTIAQVLQRDDDQVKKYMKYLAIENGYPMLLGEEGHPVLDLWGNYQGISEADASTENAAVLIETIHKYASENGIELEEG